MAKAVTLLSGGMDSATLLYDLLDDDYEVHALSFDYGQRHRKELGVALALVEATSPSVKHDIIKLGVLGDGGAGTFPLADVLSGSSLTDPSVPVPDGHYAEESMKATVVPNRNAIMLSIAYGVALAEEVDVVTFAAHEGDHTIYPDCRPEFVDALNEALQRGARWDSTDRVPELMAPFLDRGFDKTAIAKLGAELGVPFHLTWSCYKGGKIHCGTCGTCVERKEAFQLAGVTDPTAYEVYDAVPS